ncbi:MAG: hypothetical protein PVG78_00490 [Desulfobacterales bacterium]
MKKILIAVVVLAALCLFGALNYHVILFDDEIKILRKVDLTFTDTVVDARGMKRFKLATRPNLVRAGIVELIEGNGVTIRK